MRESVNLVILLSVIQLFLWLNGLVTDLPSNGDSLLLYFSNTDLFQCFLVGKFMDYFQLNFLVFPFLLYKIYTNAMLSITKSGKKAALPTKTFLKIPSCDGRAMVHFQIN